MYKYSDEHIKYIKNISKEKRLILLFRVLIIMIFIIAWELLSHFNIINSFLYSSPTRIVKTILSLVNNGELFKHISITLYEVFISFFISMFLGILVSSILWSNFKLFKILDPYITVINSLPKVALGPLIIVWIGASTNSIIFMSVTISLFTTVIGIYTGFSSVNNNHLTMLKSFGASKLQLFYKVILPSNIENIMSCLKINISMSLIGVIMGELLVSKCGLGYLIMYGSQVFNLDLVISSIIILAFISYIMFFILDYISKIIKRRF